MSKFLTSAKQMENTPLVNIQQLSEPKLTVSVVNQPVQSANIYESLSNFLFDRFKFEFSVEIIDMLIQSELFKKSMIKKLFPKTFELITIFRKNPELTSLETIKQKFQDDLEEIPENSLSVLSDTNLPFIDSNYVEILQIFIKYYRQVLNGKHSSDYFSKLADLNPDPKSQLMLSLKNIITVYTIVKDNFKTNNDALNWTSNLNTLNENAKNILISLLCNLINESNLKSLHGNISINDKETLIMNLQNLSSNLNEIELAVKSLQSGNKDYLYYLEQTKNLLINSNNLYKSLTGDISTYNSFSEFLEIKLIDKFLSIILCIQKKEYINAVTQVYLIGLESTNKSNNAKLKDLYRYSTLAAQLSSASSNEEMKNILLILIKMLDSF